MLGKISTSVLALSLSVSSLYAEEEKLAEASKAEMQDRIERLESMVNSLTAKLDDMSRKQEVDQIIDQPEDMGPFGSENASSVGLTPGEQAILDQNGIELSQQDQNEQAMIAMPQDSDSSDPDAIGDKQESMAEIPSEETATTISEDTSKRELPTGSAQEIFEYSRSLMSQGKFQDAEAGFQELVKLHPTDPLVVNAKYWLGETYYMRQDYTKASFAFAEAYKQYRTIKQDGKDLERTRQAMVKAPESLLKLSMCLKQLGRVAHAESTLKQLEKEFPKLPHNLVRLRDDLRSSLTNVSS